MTAACTSWCLKSKVLREKFKLPTTQKDSQGNRKGGKYVAENSWQKNIGKCFLRLLFEIAIQLGSLVFSTAATAAQNSRSGPPTNNGVGLYSARGQLLEQDMVTCLCELRNWSFSCLRFLIKNFFLLLLPTSDKVWPFCTVCTVCLHLRYGAR